MKGILNSSNLSNIVGFLTADDIECLYMATLDQNLKEECSRLMLNYIYYDRYLNFDHSFNLTWGYKPEDCFSDCSAYRRTIVQQPSLDLVGVKHRMENYRKLLIQNLQAFLSECQPESSTQIADDIFQCLKEGPLLIPRLRREQIGMNCNSPLQYFFADQLTQEQAEVCDEATFQPLRQALLSNQTDIIDKMIQIKPLIKNRFQPELVTEFTPNGSELLDLIDLVVLTVDTHVEGVYSVLKAESTPVQRLVYFVSHYLNYRQSVLGLQEKLGFIFEEFDLIFHEVHPQCSDLYNPCFSLVTIMLRIWHNRMKEFHLQLSHTYSYLLTNLRQNSLSKLFQSSSQQDQNFTNETSLNAMKALQFVHKLPGHASFIKDPYYRELCSNKVACKHIIHHYTEYLVDLSVNEVTVHFNDHSEQQIGRVYKQAERVLVEQTGEFYAHIYNTFHEPAILKYLVESDLEIVKALVKPITTKKIVSGANSLMENVSNRIKLNGNQKEKQQLTEINKSGQWFAVEFNKMNKLIESAVKNMNLPVEIPQQLKDLYDITKPVDLDQINEFMDIDDTKMNRSEIESYMSEGEMEVEGEGMEIEESNREKMSESEPTANTTTIDEEEDFEKGKRQRQHFLDCDQSFGSLKKRKTDSHSSSQ